MLGLDVEMCANVADDGAVLMHTRRQWLVIAGVRLPIPRWLGGARTREWQTDDGGIGLALVVSSPLLLGDYLAYEAVFAPA